MNTKKIIICPLSARFLLIASGFGIISCGQAQKSSFSALPVEIKTEIAKFIPWDEAEKLKTVEWQFGSILKKRITLKISDFLIVSMKIPVLSIGNWVLLYIGIDSVDTMSASGIH